jgi:hypothetical protein
MEATGEGRKGWQRRDFGRARRRGGASTPRDTEIDSRTPQGSALGGSADPPDRRTWRSDTTTGGDGGVAVAAGKWRERARRVICSARASFDIQSAVVFSIASGHKSSAEMETWQRHDGRRRAGGVVAPAAVEAELTAEDLRRRKPQS